jgi:hypothetical protein
MDLFKKVPPPTCGAFSKDFLSKEEEKKRWNGLWYKSRS